MTTVESDLAYWVRTASKITDPAEREKVLRAGMLATCPSCQDAARRQADAIHDLLQSAKSALHSAVAHAASLSIHDRICGRAS